MGLSIMYTAMSWPCWVAVPEQSVTCLLFYIHDLFVYSLLSVSAGDADALRARALVCVSVHVCSLNVVLLSLGVTWCPAQLHAMLNG